MTEFEQLKAAIDAKMSTNPQIRHILKLIESGKASFNDSAKYTQILSHLLGRELASQILELSDREGTTSQLLRGAYDEVNDLCSQVQSSLDKKAGIGLNPKQAPFPAERVEQYAHSLVDPTVEDSVIKRRAGAGSETITKSYHDDFIETNAEFREDAGFKCYIIRMGTDCCQWCSDVAGKYEMKEQPQGIFRRHDNCDCTIIYDGQVLRGQTGSEGKRGKKWVEVPNKAGSADAVRFTQVQAKALNDKKVEINLPTIDNYVKGGILKGEYNEQDIIRAIKQEGTNFVTRDINDKESLFGEFVEQIPSNKSYYDIKAHGSPNAVKLFGSVVDAQTLAKVIILRKDYDGRPIRLLCCETGKIQNGTCFAKELSKLLGVKVIAPTEDFWVSSSGRITIESRLTKEKGRMRAFGPYKR